MKPLAIIGVVLIVLGIAGLVVENVSFTEQKTVFLDYTGRRRESSIY